MAIILLGAIVLIILGLMWFSRANNLMGIGMLVMGVIALSNYYLHVQSMKK